MKHGVFLCLICKYRHRNIKLLQKFKSKDRWRFLRFSLLGLGTGPQETEVLRTDRTHGALWKYSQGT